MIGPPGAGKSMLAARLPGLLPDLSLREALDVTMLHSIAGQLPAGGLIQTRPYRDPHHSASMAALVGGGARAKPGEISLAHRGVLFLDELAEFAKPVLDALRQPLETGSIVAARFASSLQATRPDPDAHLDSHLAPGRLTDPARQLLELAVDKQALTARGFHRVLRVARTISNLAWSEQIDRPHLAEALAYRAMPLLA